MEGEQRAQTGETSGGLFEGRRLGTGNSGWQGKSGSRELCPVMHRSNGRKSDPGSEKLKASGGRRRTGQDSFIRLGGLGLEGRVRLFSKEVLEVQEKDEGGNVLAGASNRASCESTDGGGEKGGRGGVWKNESQMTSQCRGSI